MNINKSFAIPRLVISGISSGCGKTTAAVALVSALRAKGLRVAAFKAGPDYLDPTYLARAAGGTCYNLDSWMMGRETILATFLRASEGADIALIEGMMGLFDGLSSKNETASTAQIAKWLGAPVLLAVDASGMARSIAAVAHGFAYFDPDLNLAGIIANSAGSKGHLGLLKEAATDVPVVGGLPSRPDLAFTERHLGLRAATSETLAEDQLHAWSEICGEWFELDRLLDIARSAPLLNQLIEAAPEMPPKQRCRIGVAQDEAFHFYYEDNLSRLKTLGAELVPFSPVRDSALPEIDGIYLGGGYPELHAEALSKNEGMREAVRRFAAGGGVVYAECGGLMYLCSGIRTVSDTFYPMAGVFPAETIMSERLQAIGYVKVETTGRSFLGGPGLQFRGHQFRYSRLRPTPRNTDRMYTLRAPSGGGEMAEGYRISNTVASYVHAHWASNPEIAENFVAACAG